MTWLRFAGFSALALLAACASYNPLSPAFYGDDLADRGIGGTGIVGVITGFGSVWVDGVEVALDDATAVDADGRTIAPEDLRIGQVAVIAASGTPSELTASSISIRYEVSGPVEAVDEADHAMMVAGQRVVVAGDVAGDVQAGRGDWVAVSGIRRPDGDIVATRIDRRLPGMVTVRGPLAVHGSSLRVGRLEVAGDVPEDAGAVVLSGRYADGVLIAEAAEPDLIATDPGRHFGDDVGRVLIETYVRSLDGELQINGGLISVAGGDAPAGFAGGQLPVRAVVELTRRADGGLEARGVRVTHDAVGPLGGGAVGPHPRGIVQDL